MLGPRKGRAERGRQSGSGVGFSTGQDSATFREKGTEVPSLSWDKGTTGQPKSGTGRAGTAKNRDGTRDKTGQGRKGCSKTEKDVLEQKRMF